MHFQVFLELGAPEELLSDLGPEFVNLVVQHLCELVNKTETSGYHQAANEQVEELNSKVLAVPLH